MNMTKPSLVKKPYLQAFEDALVVGSFSGLGGLIAAGFPPTVEVFYGASTAAALAGLITYARARRIQLMP